MSAVVTNCSNRKIVFKVGTKNRIDSVEAAIFNHLNGTTRKHFFTVLMNEEDCALEFLLQGLKGGGQSEDDCRVSIMSAGMHHTGTD